MSPHHLVERFGADPGALSAPADGLGFALPSARRLAAWLIGGVALLTVLGAIAQSTDSLRAFGLTRELGRGFNLPVIVSGGLLFAAAAFALACTREAASGGMGRLAWGGIAVLFTYMGLDELLTFHEHLETFTGVDWEVLYAPVAAGGACLWVVLLFRMPPGSLRRLVWIGGAVGWVVAQVLEDLQWQGPRRVDLYDLLANTEEALEMGGSALFLIALYASWLTLRDRRDPATAR